MYKFISHCYPLPHYLVQGASSSSVTIVTEAGRKTSVQWQGWSCISDDISVELYCKCSLLTHGQHQEQTARISFKLGLERVRKYIKTRIVFKTLFQSTSLVL